MTKQLLRLVPILLVLSLGNAKGSSQSAPTTPPATIVPAENPSVVALTPPEATNPQPSHSANLGELLTKAGDGNSEAQYQIGEAFLAGKGVKRDRQEAARWILKAAEQGHTEAQLQLGRAYAIGNCGVEKDAAKSMKWFRSAANQNNADALCELACIYEAGNSVVTKDSGEAIQYYLKAANLGDSFAQFKTGQSYYSGEVVPKDEIEALAWINISATGGRESFIEKRDDLARTLGRQTTLLAQQRSKEILKEIESDKMRRAGAPATPPAVVMANDVPKSSGSGTIVTLHGHVLTAAHVVVGAKQVAVITAKGFMTARVLCIDESNDVAVLKVEGGPFVPVPVAPSRRVRLGQTVATIGFPNTTIQGFSPKVTRGEISSQNGAGDDPRSWQISVPVQRGNSGGPLLDENGNLIGIVVSKLGIKAAMLTGDLPQNVGYAMKSAYALALLEPYLDTNVPELNQPNPKQTFEDMVSNVQQSIVLVLVY